MSPNRHAGQPERVTLARGTLAASRARAEEPAPPRTAAPPSPPVAAAGPSDESLLRALGTGDEEAAAAFVHRFRRRVYGLALAIVGDPSAAEDIAQESLVRAWRHADVYDPSRASVVTWLLTITRNASIDHLRRRRAEPVDPGALLALGTEALGPAPDEVAASADDAERVRNAVAKLPSRQRRAVVMASLHGRTAKEIGGEEGIPLGTAKTRIRSGLLQLRAIMTSEAMDVPAVCNR